ncbi:hypothetical protein C5167_030184 [Papaver somniferum]|uniref:uncharacterized protein LOC113329883 n=1 Tax=Papaver somniferum TaxID=3469 RepID=UPI000E6F954C|nr:uncharacterized protein LOC113329883 [Papaver somniferum]RZC86833.1 hypothetical protein C5167_030184 [Papaver somniferum]
MADNDIRNFYLDARVLYRRLVLDSGREIVITMQAIALWIVLEGMGFPNLVRKFLKIHEMVVNKLLDEADMCLRCVQSVQPPVPAVNMSDMPLTEGLMGGNKRINLMLVYTNSTNVITKVNETVFGSFSIAFDDIIQEVSGMSFPELNVLPLAQDLLEGHAEQAAPCFDAPSAYSSVLPNHTTLGKDEHVPESKRAIFCTFTREYPVQQKELESFLERSYGERCIEKITMQQVPGNEHPSWASIIFHSQIPVQEIMQGRETAPININGKHVWAGSLEFMERL